MKRVCLYTAVLLATSAAYAQSSAGVVRFIRHANSSFDAYTDNPTSTQQQWFRDHFWRMVVFSPYFDTKLTWYPNGDAYIDLYAIYNPSTLATQHPEWILRDQYGNKLYLPWACSGGTCAQYAGDITNAAFRSWWIGQAQTVLGLGYHGLWIDDVNMEFRVSNGYGNFVAPIDPNTGAPMTWDNWRLYIAQFVEQIRNTFPNAELIHNSIWFAGPSGVRDQDPYIQRQIRAASHLNIEHGVNDSGLTGGTGQWSLNALLGYIDRVHSAGRPVIMDGVPQDAAGEEYALANYYLISVGADEMGNETTTPGNWWTGYQTNLGSPLAARTTWNNLLRRDYTGGMVLVNPPQAVTITVSLPGTYKRLDGTSVTSVTLGAKQGSVLLGNSAAAASCPAPATSAFTACYYKDTTLTALGLVRTDASVNFDWGYGSPDPSIPSDNFSAKWEGKFYFTAANHTFTVTADDGVRLYIDGAIVIDKWIDQWNATYTVTKSLTAGTHTIKMTYYDHTGGAVAKLSWN